MEKGEPCLEQEQPHKHSSWAMAAAPALLIKIFVQAVKQELHHKNEEGTDTSAWVKGAQLKNFRFGALLYVTLQPCLFLPGDQLPKATGHSAGLSGLTKRKYSS